MYPSYVSYAQSLVSGQCDRPPANRGVRFDGYYRAWLLHGRSLAAGPALPWERNVRTERRFGASLSSQEFSSDENRLRRSCGCELPTRFTKLDSDQRQVAGRG